MYLRVPQVVADTSNLKFTLVAEAIFCTRTLDLECLLGGVTIGKFGAHMEIAVGSEAWVISANAVWYRVPP